MFIANRCGVMTSKGGLVKTYATWSPTDKSPDITLSNSNLTCSNAGSWRCARATQGKSSGKWVFEVSATYTAATTFGFGDVNFSVGSYIGGTPLSGGFYFYHNSFVGNGVTTSGSTPGTAANTPYMIALDLSAGKGWITNGSGGWVQGDPASGTSPSFTWTPGTMIFPACSTYASPVTANFGSSAFSHSVPSGFNSGWYTES